MKNQHEITKALAAGVERVNVCDKFQRVPADE